MDKHSKAPIHPGEILADELTFLGINAAQLAEKIGVPNNRVYQILNGARGITADTAMRLGLFFGISPHFWMNLQKSYELDVVSQDLSCFKDIQPYVQHATG